MTCKIIDDFLPKDDFVKLQSFILGDWFPWFYNPFILDDNKYVNYQFTHVFFRKEKQDPVTSPHYSFVEPLIIKLGVKNLFRIKANLRPQTFKPEYGGYHFDPFPKGLIAIYYINTNNGWTEFKDGNKVKSVENRMVVFDCNLEHTGVSCTDQKRRVLINFNYE